MYKIVNAHTLINMILADLGHKGLTEEDFGKLTDMLIFNPSKIEIVKFLRKATQEITKFNPVNFPEVKNSKVESILRKHDVMVTKYNRMALREALAFGQFIYNNPDAIITNPDFRILDNPD